MARDLDNAGRGIDAAAGSTTTGTSEGQRTAGGEDRYRALIDARVGVVWRYAPDMSVIEAWGWGEISGQAASDFIGDGWLAGVHPDDRDSVRAVLAEAPLLAEPCECSYRVRQRDGHYRRMHARMAPVKDQHGCIREWLGNLIDIEDRSEAEAMRLRAEQRLRLALESSSLGLWEYDCRTRTGWCSAANRQLLGLPQDHPATAESFLAVIHPADRPAVERRLAEAARGVGEGHFEAEYRVQRAHDGAEVHIASIGQVSFDEAGNPVRIFGSVRDVTAERETRQKLYELAHFDEVTGLSNRRHFTDELEELLQKGRRGTVMLMDLDGFKNLNDTVGHRTGDLLLRMAARRITRSLPRPALVCRWAGDEFVAFIPDGQPQPGTPPLTCALERTFAEPFVLSRRKLFVTASIGLALAPAHGWSAEELVANANLALCRARTIGRGLCRTFGPDLREEAQSRLDLEEELRCALESAEFELHYQPQVVLATGRTVGAEALLRWRHPRKGLLPPGYFLSVLNSSPIAAAVGDWVLTSACEAAGKLRRSGSAIRIGVNLFAAQLRDGSLLETVRSCLAENELPPELLELEITEDIVLSGDARSIDTLGQLRRLGVGIAFDDYGTGYASLRMLTEYPITRLKVDRSFVQRMLESRGDASIVQAIVSLAHGFGLQVTAEGVENRGQAAAIRALGCHEVQGYLFGRPMPLDELSALLAETQGCSQRDQAALEA